VGNLLPSTAKSSTLGSLSGPPQCRLKGNLRESVHLSGASGTRQIPGSPIVRHCRALGASPLPRPLAGDSVHLNPLAFPFCSTYPALMPRDFITLSEMPQAVRHDPHCRQARRVSGRFASTLAEGHEARPPESLEWVTASVCGLITPRLRRSSVKQGG
jgi:hypothetical protein